MNEQLYNDFINKFLPEIQKGLVITKDYFLDLSSRYIIYLKITDGLTVLMSLIGIFTPFVIGYKAYKEIQKNESSDFWITVLITVGVIGLFVVIFGIGGIIYGTDNLIKDFFIPEVRILELVKQVKN